MNNLTAQRSIGERVVDGLIIGAVQAVVLVVILIAATYALGNKQQESLNDIKAATRAEVCVLALPVSDKGRDDAAVTRCLVNAGIEP